MPLDGTYLTEAQTQLLRAADLIRTRGHAKCALEDHTGALCLIGALRVAIDGKISAEETRTSDAWRKLSAWESADAENRHLPGWNNKPERTAEEVISLLETLAFKE